MSFEGVGPIQLGKDRLRFLVTNLCEELSRYSSAEDTAESRALVSWPLSLFANYIASQHEAGVEESEYKESTGRTFVDLVRSLKDKLKVRTHEKLPDVVREKNQMKYLTL